MRFQPIPKPVALNSDNPSDEQKQDQVRRAGHSMKAARHYAGKSIHWFKGHHPDDKYSKLMLKYVRAIFWEDIAPVNCTWAAMVLRDGMYETSPGHPAGEEFMNLMKEIMNSPEDHNYTEPSKFLEYGLGATAW